MSSGEEGPEGRTGAVAAGRLAGDDRDGRRRGAVWLLLALLALIIVAVLLIVLIAGGGGRESAKPAGQVTANGRPLIPLPPNPRSLVGETATAKGAVVQAVNPNEGFWIGSGKRDRLYVEYGGDVGQDEARFVPQVRQRVNLSGPVRRAPGNPSKLLRLTPSDARQVESQGVYINADRATTSG